MNNFKLNTFLYVCTLFVGSFLMIQCDRDSRGDGAYQTEQQTQTPGQTDTSDAYAQNDMEDMNRGNQAQNFNQQRDQLLSDMEDLREDINDQIERQGTEDSEEEAEVSTDEMKTDLAELDQAISEMRNTQTTESRSDTSSVNQDNTDQNLAQQNYQQLYNRLSEKYRNLTLNDLDQ